jgi:hypothetical protein
MIQHSVDSLPDAPATVRQDAYWSGVIRDLAVIAVLTAGFFIFAIHFELSERLSY